MSVKDNLSWPLLNKRIAQAGNIYYADSDEAYDAIRNALAIPTKISTQVDTNPITPSPALPRNDRMQARTPLPPQPSSPRWTQSPTHPPIPTQKSIVEPKQCCQLT